MKTQVCIIGGGPSGLMLSQLLHLKGIDTVVLERQSREYVLGRIRAGVLEHGFAALMREAQCGERMDREGEIHEGFFIAHDGRMDRVDLHKYSGGSSVVVYGQTELTRDLYEARDRMKGVVIHNAEDVQPHDLKSAKPYVTYRNGDEIVRIDCDYVIGADGFHGVSRKSIPKDVLKEYEKVYPFGWLGVLSRTKPVSPELIYAQPRARLRAVLAALAGAQPLLHPGAADGHGRGLDRRRVLGRAEAPPAGRGGGAAWSPGPRSRSRSRRCARSSPSRCATATCSWPATRRTSCRPPARAG